MLKRIVKELTHHAPFTLIGAVGGIVIMIILVQADAPAILSERTFHFLHPLHVVLSALTTTAMYRKYVSGGTLWQAVLIGFLGSVGIASLSDAVIPYLGGALLGLDMEFHLPIISTEPMPFIGVPTWTTIASGAVIGIAIGYLKPATKFPHLGHVFLSTGASLFYFTAYGLDYWTPVIFLVFVFLFLAVWLPCCVSDIVFPLLFTRGELIHEH